MTATIAERERERGVVVAITAKFIVALLGVVALFMHYGYLSAVQTELQAAADAAALTAVGRLNSSTSGWDRRKRDVGFLEYSRTCSASRIGPVH